MTIEIQKESFLTQISFLNKGEVKFAQIKQDNGRQKCRQNMRRDSVIAYVHVRRDTSSPYTQLHLFWMTPHPPPVAYVPN